MVQLIPHFFITHTTNCDVPLPGGRLAHHRLLASKELSHILLQNGADAIGPVTPLTLVCSCSKNNVRKCIDDLHREYYMPVPRYVATTRRRVGSRGGRY